MRYVLTAAEMRALDAATIDEIGIPGAVLMENAGRALADQALAAIDRELGHVAVVCGSGNNGGDGFVAARWLREAGVSATVYLCSDDDRVRGDAAVHLAAYRQSGGTLTRIADAAELAEQRDAIESADAVLDCVFGTGLDREVTGHYRAVLELINRCSGEVIACDIPSGLSADTGEVMGAAVIADRTVTMAFLKLGLAVSPGFASAGEVAVASIGIPRRLAQAQGVRVALLEPADVAGDLPEPGLLDHKNRRGHVLVVGGSPGKFGAGRLTAWAAMRSGAGLVTLAGSEPDAGAPDPVMTAAVGSPEALLGASAGKRAIAIGPGMDPADGGRALVRAALAAVEAPLVIDADALNHLGTDLAAVAAARVGAVLTPHPGEAARLLGTDTAAVERDRVAAVRELAERAQAVVVLKGARTLVCDGIAGDGFVTVNPTGNPGLATAGSGDVLTGVIAALIAQGVAAADAARLGVWLHGAAADHLSRELGPRSMTASDLIEALPAAMAALA